MPELIINRGIPGSGKSTYANAWVQEELGRVRVNRDDIRFQCYGVYFGKPIDEGVVTAIEDAMIIAALKAEVSVIVDDCNIAGRYVYRFKRMAAENGADFSVVLHDVPLKVALKRNSNRERFVPENVIRSMYDNLMKELSYESKS